MSISEACIRRPVMTTLITASFIVFGIFAYRLLAGRGAAARSTSRPSRSPRRCRARAPRPWRPRSPSPIERQFSTIAGIIVDDLDVVARHDHASPSSSTSTATSTAPRSTCRPRSPVAQRRLPVEMTTPPCFRKVNPGDFPVLFISLNSPTLPLSTVNEYGQTVLAQQISQLPGVAQVLVYGAQKFAVRVQVDPVAAAARNISLDDIRTVARQGQLQRAGRHARGPRSRTSRCRRPARCGKADGLPQRRRRLAQRRAGQARAKSPTSSTASRTTRSRAGSTATARSCSRSSASPTPTPSRWSTRSRSSCRPFRAQIPAVDQHGGADRPLDLDPRVGRTTCRRRC